MNKTENKPKIPTNKRIEKLLSNVYDPEFPVIDIFNLGLIYDIFVDKKKKSIDILMTLTSPACPAGDFIVGNIKEEILNEYKNYELNIEITFDPLWTPKNIKDEDLQRMFDI